MENKVTYHAEKRMKQRCGFGKKTAERMSLVVLQRGLAHRELNGEIRKYVDMLYLQSQKMSGANNIMVYGNYAWLFKDETLITVLTLPTNMNMRVSALIKKKRCKEHEVCIDNSSGST